MTEETSDSPSSSTPTEPLDTPHTMDVLKDSTDQNIFAKFRAIKQKNEALKSTTYSQFWKQTTTSHNIFLSAFYFEKRRMHIAFLESQVPTPRSPAVFSFDAKNVHAIDQMDMHKQTSEMIYSTLTNTAMSASKMQVTLNNVSTSLKIEKISSLAKDSGIKSLEDLVIKLGYDPQNVKAVEELINRKNAEIMALRKQLKLSTNEDPQTKSLRKENMRRGICFKLL